ncbi:hypothetical protein [Intestinimonas sp.]|uniref:hypothetical protein n=1 Tax=Intestinimonas sp. TaxID=1965293 RepID=UPI0026244C1E|nr:hypothetical protein [Intestinimonas sp.]
MKQRALLCVLALLLGASAGLLLNVSQLSGRGLLAPGAISASAAPSAVLFTAQASAIDPDSNAPLLEAGSSVLAALKAGDLQTLAALVDPDRGVTFTSYSTVDPRSDLTFLPDQLSQAGMNRTPYVWGYTQGKGDAITMTLPEYLTSYVFNIDYTQAPMIGVDALLSSGNSLENVRDAYPEDRFLEYYFPGQDPEVGGLDWCALKLVFSDRDHTGSYRLVGIIHSEWTI